MTCCCARWRSMKIRLDFAEAYLVALAELSDVKHVASFDRQIDRVKSVQRVEP